MADRFVLLANERAKLGAQNPIIGYWTNKDGSEAADRVSCDVSYDDITVGQTIGVSLLGPAVVGKKGDKDDDVNMVEVTFPAYTFQSGVAGKQYKMYVGNWGTPQEIAKWAQNETPRVPRDESEDQDVNTKIQEMANDGDLHNNEPIRAASVFRRTANAQDEYVGDLFTETAVGQVQQRRTLCQVALDGNGDRQTPLTLVFYTVTYDVP